MSNSPKNPNPQTQGSRSDDQASIRSMLGSILNEYGMLFVLLLLGILFSALTWAKQNPTGADAGEQVADKILAQQGKQVTVMVVVSTSDDDLAFSNAAVAKFEQEGVHVTSVVRGKPADARRAIEAALEEGLSIDAIAANAATAGWTVYDRFPEVGREKCVTPEPYYWSNFLKVSNLIGVANQTAIYAIIAIGMTMVIITAGIDLSVGSLIALSAVSSAIFVREFGGADAGVAVVVIGAMFGVLVSSAAGAFNGAMITGFRLPPFIVTLGMMMIASGLAFRISNGASVPQLPESFFWFGAKKTLGIPHPVILMVVLYVIAYFVMTCMVFGRYVYAIGGNEESARLSGVPIKRTLLVVYTLSGTLAGVGGVLLASQLAAGDPKFGLMYELDVIAAVVVGGTSLMGGRGKVLGTLIGAFIIAVIKNGMNLTSVDPFNQKIVLGAVLLAAVLIDRLKRGKAAD